MRFWLAVLVAATSLSIAHARDNAAWDASPSDVRKWFQSLRQPDNPAMSCCGESDAYWADSFEMSTRGEYVAIITDERKVLNRRHIDVGTKFTIPNHKLKYDAGNPTGHGVVFINQQGLVLCYIAPGGI